MASMTASHPRVCLVPRLKGLGGMVSFQARLVAGFEQHGVEISYDLKDPHCAAVLVIGGTRQVGAVWQARRRGVRVVQRLNGMNWIHRRRPGSLRYFLRAETNNILLAFIRRWLADRIVYQSHFSQGWWEGVYGPTPARTQVTYNGVDLKAFSPDGEQARPEGSFRVLLVEGHLSGYDQGLENAIRLVGLLRSEHHLPVELQVVGDVPVDVRAKADARVKAWLPGGIDWQGVLRRDQIPAIDRSAHLMFSADLNAACPNAVIEAMAAGLPVAAFDTGALAELVTAGAGRVVPYGSNYWKLEAPVVAPLAAAAVEILNDNGRFRAAARARAEAVFGLEQMVTGYMQVLLG
jgi:glycosyltransferase involved in cell wall biosynthesis